MYSKEDVIIDILRQLELDIRAWKLLERSAQADKKESRSFGYKAAALEDFRKYVVRTFQDDIKGRYIMKMAR